jgi:capsule polysaccharide export protein KpsC/LpsZ
MTRQLGVDLEDIYLNGDTATPETDPDYDFLKLNDGWIKQIENGGHVEDRTSISSGAMSIGVYYDALKEMPNKYNNGTLRWLMSPRRKQEWKNTCLIN